VLAQSTGARRALDLLASMVSIVPVLSLAIRTAEFVFYHLLLSLVDHVSGLPRDMMVPEAMRLYRENIALKAQLEALERHLVRVETKRKRVSLAVRAAQVFAYRLLEEVIRLLRRQSEVPDQERLADAPDTEARVDVAPRRVVTRLQRSGDAVGLDAGAGTAATRTVYVLLGTGGA